MTLLQKNKRKKVFLGEDGNALVLLIAFSVIAFIILSFLKIIYLSNNSTEGAFVADIVNRIAVPAKPQVFASRPWSLLTYLFAQTGVWELISGMLWLGAFGYILQDLTGNRKIIPVYLYSGLAGSVFFLLTANLIPSLRENINSIFPLTGSAPAIMGLAVATTTIAPRYRIFPMLNIPLWAVTGIFILFRVGTAGYGNIAGLAALFAGGLMGYVFAWQLQKGNDLGQWMTDLARWTDNLFNPEKGLEKHPVKSQLFYKTTQKPFQKTPHITQQHVDELLEKIHSHGFESLSEEEKDFLKKASREEL